MNPSTDTPSAETQRTEQVPAAGPVPESRAPGTPPLAPVVTALQSLEARDREDRLRAEQAALMARQRFD